MLITLMGKSGSGKTTIGMLLESKDKDIKVLDVDKIVRNIYMNSELKDKVRNNFGNEVFNEYGSVDKSKLSKIVFSNKSKLKLLEDITYEYIENEIDDFISKNKIVILDYALIPKTKYYDLSDLKILVIADTSRRNLRIQKRDNISENDFLLRDANSLDYTNLHFNYIIQNNSNTKHLRKVVDSIYEKGILPRKF